MITNNRQTEEKITALYERLSKDDGVSEESNSIINQKIMLEKYAKDNGFSNTAHYTDDGYSGGNFERPSWKQLVADIEDGKVGCVIAKDMSRIGRDYLQTGFYTEVLFRQHGVRFIAISNGVDSDIEGSNEFAPFLNIMNEWYLRDCSRKSKAAHKARSDAGKPTSSSAIYGYKKDPEDKNHWIIDEEAAAVVKRIFNLTIEGKGPGQIARILKADKIERPSMYLARHNQGTYQNVANTDEPYFWRIGTITRILAKPEYLGHTVNFRYHKRHYKDKYPVEMPREEWIIIENTHEPIVDKETWDLVQKLRKTPRRADNEECEANPLTGLVYCADCGAKMYNHRARSGKWKGERKVDPETGLFPHDHYDCSTFNLSRYRNNRKCFGHYINTLALRAIILDAIRLTSKYAIENRDEFIAKVREASQIQQADKAKELKKQLAKNKKRYSELDNIIKKLYESYAVGKISEKRFDMLSEEYEAEQTELETVIHDMQRQLDSFNEDTDRANQFLELAEKYTNFDKLTTPMINEFIDKIVVHAPDKSTGERIQDVDIYLKFIGKFDVPVPEPTPEELAAAEKLRLKRQKQREANKRYREKQKRLKLEAQEQKERSE